MYCLSFENLSLIKARTPQAKAKQPNPIKRASLCKYATLTLPIMLPAVVGISMTRPSGIFIISFLKNLIDDAREVASTATMLVPIARCMGIFRRRLKKGTIIIPPPIPMTEPTSPAKSPIKINIKVITSLNKPAL